MSVIRQPRALGRTTRRRVMGTAAALSTAVIETIAVGCWFALVVGSRTTSTALAGLGLLFCGALSRAGIFGVTVTQPGDVLQPRRLAVALLFTTGWIVWLLVAELVGGVAGVTLAAGLLAGILSVQFALEHRVFSRSSGPGIAETPIVSGLLLAAGGSTLLATAWFFDWGLSSPPLSVGVTTVVVLIEPLQIGVVVFGLFAFLAHYHRLRRFLDH
ncbi:hypothetical protein [Natrinema ejinorense]|uniref:Uncharacterized protein n=1 Tax=Natrinema ejinorense TaxID=373386 RepID=A0A2A5QTX2_9EURY|nr:hypothetical protein [Natrinema ejinorense]PCR90287.1 hypothetical protein CP557_06870 [Natrinema ejinorense]